MIDQNLRNWIVTNTPLPSAQVHMSRAIQGTPSPYIVISGVTDLWGDTHDGDDGTAEGVWQVSVFSTSLSTLKSTVASVNALHGATLTGAARVQKTGAVDMYEQDAGVYHTAIRFLIQYYT